MNGATGLTYQLRPSIEYAWPPVAVHGLSPGVTGLPAGKWQPGSGYCVGWPRKACASV